MPPPLSWRRLSLAPLISRASALKQQPGSCQSHVAQRLHLQQVRPAAFGFNQVQHPVFDREFPGHALPHRHLSAVEGLFSDNGSASPSAKRAWKDKEPVSPSKSSHPLLHTPVRTLPTVTKWIPGNFSMCKKQLHQGKEFSGCLHTVLANVLRGNTL